MRCRALSPEGHIIWFGKTMDSPNAAYYQIGSDSGYTEEPLSAGWATFKGDLTYVTRDTENGGKFYVFKKGGVIKIGNETYRILKTNNKTLTLMGLKTYTSYKPFDKQTFANSELYQYLNTTVYNAFPQAIRAAIQLSTCSQELWTISDKPGSASGGTYAFGSWPNAYYLIYSGSLQTTSYVKIKLCSIRDIVEYFNAKPYPLSGPVKLSTENLDNFFSGDTWLLDSVDSSYGMGWTGGKIQPQKYSTAGLDYATLPSKVVFDLNLVAINPDIIDSPDFAPVDIGEYNNTNHPAVPNYVSGTDAVIASLTQRLSVIKGELWYQVNYGLPLTEKQRGTNVLDLVIGDIISSHPGVASLDSYTSKVNGHTYFYECKITSVFGDTAIISNNLTF